MSTLLPDWDTQGKRIMDDPDREEATEVPCPCCAEPSLSLTEPCAQCQLEAKSRKLADETAKKYPIIKPFDGMGTGMP